LGIFAVRGPLFLLGDIYKGSEGKFWDRILEVLTPFLKGVIRTILVTYRGVSPFHFGVWFLEGK